MKTPRLAAEIARKITYLGSPCRHCGGTERYVVNGGCVPCVKGLAVTWTRTKRAEKS